MSSKQFEVRITPLDVDTRVEGKAVLRSTPLVNGLVRKSETTLQTLEAEVASVRLETISIDECGRIVIEDEAFRAALQQKLEQSLQGDDAAIGDYQCSIVTVNIFCVTF